MESGRQRDARRGSHIRESVCCLLVLYSTKLSTAVDTSPASPYTYSSSTPGRFPDAHTPIEATPLLHLSATSVELGAHAKCAIFCPYEQVRNTSLAPHGLASAGSANTRVASLLRVLSAGCSALVPARSHTLALLTRSSF